MPEAINGKRLVELVPGLDDSLPGLTDALASLANVVGETILNLRRLNLTPEQSEEVNGIFTRALGRAARSGIELGQKTKQPLGLDGLIDLNEFVGAAIRMGIENVTQPATSKSEGLP